MDNRIVITMSGVVAIAIYAVLEASVVMGVSAVSIGIAAYLFRNAKIRDRLIGIIAAALGGAIGAEIVHTFYYHMNAAEPVADSGELFLSAIIIGLVNAAVIVVLVVLTEVWFKAKREKSE